MYEEEGYEYVKDCGCGIRERRIIEKKLQFATIPTAFRDIQIGSFHVDAYKDPASQQRAANVISVARYYIDEFQKMKDNGMGLYLYSKSCGSGKTRMAVSIANELLNRGIQSKFCTSLDIIKEIKKTWGKDGNEESKLLDELGNTEVLIIDDFGVESSKDWIRERFYAIVNDRYIAKKPTIYTSNSPLDELQHDVRITNRIKERSYVIPFPEESIRERIASSNLRKLAKDIKEKRSE